MMRHRATSCSGGGVYPRVFFFTGTLAMRSACESVNVARLPVASAATTVTVAVALRPAYLRLTLLGAWTVSGTVAPGATGTVTAGRFTVIFFALTRLRFLVAFLAFVVGQLLVFGVGVPWLKVSADMAWSDAIHDGFTIFILGGLIKAAIGAAVLPSAWQLVRRTER